MARKKKEPSRAQRNIDWINEWCRVPEGRYVGRKVKLREWQCDELRKIYDNPAGTRQAIISFPRKNGKTVLISFLLLLHLVGPEAVPNSQLYSAAISQDQAATVFKLAAKIVRLNPDLGAVVGIRDTIKQLYCTELGTTYAALSAEKSTAHGKSPVFAIHDELGQVKGPVSELYEAVETGMGAHDAPLSIVISTQAPTDNDLLSRLIDDALTARDPKTVVSVYSAPMDADPFSIETLKSCNPAWGDFLNADEVLRTRDAAIAMPASESAYRNLHLNQRIEMNSPFISKVNWDACGASVADEFTGPIWAGLDLSATRDLTAFVMISPVDNVWHVKPVFWLPEIGLKDRSLADRVPYDVWAKQGYLLTTPGKSISYEYVAQHLMQMTVGKDFRKIAFDRYAFEHLRPWLAKAGFRDEQLEGDAALFEEFGQGTKSMTPALRALESDVLEQRLAHGSHPVLNMCAANATVIGHDGDRKLGKPKDRARRIDGMIALAMARGVAGTYQASAPSLTSELILERGGLA